MMPDAEGGSEGKSHSLSQQLMKCRRLHPSLPKPRRQNLQTEVQQANVPVETILQEAPVLAATGTKKTASKDYVH